LTVSTCEVLRETRAKERARIDARVEIPPASGALRTRRVVAERRMIQRELHVLRHGQRPGFGDAVGDECLDRCHGARVVHEDYEAILMIFVIFVPL